MSSFPPFTRLAASLPDHVPFVGPEAIERERGTSFAARIGANESGFGPSPRVIEAMQASAGDMWKYCDPENYDLRSAIADQLGLDVEMVVVGEGVDGLLNLAVRMFAEPGEAVVTSLGAYPTFNFHVTGFGAKLVTVPYRDYREDLVALAEAANANNARIVYLANPDNPMGTWCEADAVEKFLAEINPHTLVILDEAYCELAPASAIPAIAPLRPNIIRMRSFSKAYGLAGIRCGYAFGPAELIRPFERVRTHYGVNRMAQVAALAAFADQAYLSEVVGLVAAGRERITQIAEENGLKALPSATNFVAVDCGADGVFAQKVLDNLIAQGIFVRKPVARGLDKFIRVSVGLDHELDLLAEALPKALATARI
ncbi:pyridoxal phosphate-dependent aminotransferase [Limoniibacter endophyticus]|uniref:Histidinol-phosphate aminotransferase n=1 Tax=Limoniibacter endophyticus TaxID=1565040 RepID=A0A8J3DGH1_9HYPH|nr:pyridoxal phosphate-dependent aminotransferase [Limoniibacter endophyticus]GHC69160.1 histidinol-phosphate aminotransferase [Limoniibacter endophyticus]